MKLKEPAGRLSRVYSDLLLKGRGIGTGHLILLSTTAFILGVGLASQVKSYVWRPIVLPMATQAIKSYGQLTHPLTEPTALLIDIKHENYQKLAYQREMALLIGKLFQTDNSFVSADVSVGGVAFRARLRLKGDNTDHLRHEKWSFRVVLKGDGRIFGLKQFSLQHPESRNYLFELLYHAFLKTEDVPSLRYHFVNVKLNGKDLGIYALEEHFDKLLVEHRRRREGPILRFNESLMWQENLQWTRPFPEADISTYGSYLSSDVDVFKTASVLADSTQRTLFRTAASLLESFRAGRLRPNDVFDVQKMADYLAVSDLLGAEHGTRWHNVRFYYNPISARLEPIGFDGMAGQLLLETFASRYGPYVGASGRRRSRIHYDNDGYLISLLGDPAMYGAYMASLRKVSAPGYLDTRLDNLSDALATEEKIIQSEFPFWQFDREILEHNRQHIQALLLPQRSVLAYFQGIGDGNLKLKMGSAQPLPVIPTALVVDTMRVEISGTHVLPGRSKPGLPTYRTVDIALAAHIEWVDAMASNLRFEFRLPGSDEKRLERVFPWLHEILHAHPGSLGLDPKPLADYDFIHIDEEHRTITPKTGAWTLDGSLTIPPGYDVIGEPGMILTMGDSAKILSRSALQLIGAESQPIVFVSKDQSGQGLFVADTGLESKLEHVEFRRLANPSHGSWALTGAVTFYQAPVTITHCRFVEMSCEDALNIVRSPFAIAHIQFADNAGDALDIDFSEGSIRWGTFLRSGNDGIDVSGTTIDITDVVMKDIGDKGLSAGENSRVTLSRTAIHRSSIALASKDLSHVTVSNLVVRNCRIGFAAFAKKPEFGPARITATELDMEDVDIPYLIEDRSTLSVDGHLHIADRERLRETLYGVKDETD